uniref:Uncharacterized protein n=1 Tax=Anopheles coluzzii TaxID=1518534 RepID=A0A8W7PT00_ANOCL
MKSRVYRKGTTNGATTYIELPLVSLRKCRSFSSRLKNGSTATAEPFFALVGPWPSSDEQEELCRDDLDEEEEDVEEERALAGQLRQAAACRVARYVAKLFVGSAWCSRMASCCRPPPAALLQVEELLPMPLALEIMLEEVMPDSRDDDEEVTFVHCKSEACVGELTVFFNRPIGPPVSVAMMAIRLLKLPRLKHSRPVSIQNSTARARWRFRGDRSMSVATTYVSRLYHCTYASRLLPVGPVPR